jgi:uncharacterized protein
MFSRFFMPPKQSFFLFGPRGTGKSTWLKQHYKDALWIDLLNPENFRIFSAAPERLLLMLEGQSDVKTIIIDEVQKVPQLLDVVHLLIEKKLNYQFILTGSSARKLKSQGTNLLGGRALLKYMAPFFAGEIKSNFNLRENISLGMLPLVLDAPSPEEVLKAYVGIYLKEEVQSERLVRNVGDFARFLESISFSHASILNASNIARECQISRKTVENYINILEDLLLSFQLQVFSRKAKRSLTKHSKFYFFDSGVFLSLRPQNYFDKESEMNGLALEGLVAQHLRAWINMQIKTYHLNFWRTSSKIEVDFILSGIDCFLALEVKNGSVVHPKDLKGLEVFKLDYPESLPVLLYRGKQIIKVKGILCYPIEEFLLQIHPQMPIDYFLKKYKE